jgi:hypothetical protein
MERTLVAKKNSDKAKAKRLPKSKRAHVRRMKQAARKAGTVYNG